MINLQSQPALPRYSLDRLTPIEPELVILAYLAINGHGSANRDVAEKTLTPLFPTSMAFAASLSALADDSLITVSRSGRCRIMISGRKQAEDTLGPLLGRTWGDVVGRSLVPLALGLDPRDEETRRYLLRKDNMECAALACLYGFATADSLPPRAEVRFLFLRALVSARLPECEAAFTEITMQNTLRDPVSRALMLGAAGLQRGSLREAEGALLRKALDVRGDGATAISDALVRNAVGKCVARPMPRVQLPPLTLAQPKSAPLPEPEAELALAPAPQKADLGGFAATVRDLARTQTTHPFAGRVAIAQVYDAGLQRGLEFGSLEAFKQRVAEAGRAGLIDLERYDIAGPMDAGLRDRSRTPFGRDVRHFIVNEWI